MSFDFSFNFGLRGGPHLLRALGFQGDGFFGGLNDFQDNLDVLGDLRDSFQGAAMGAQMLAHLLSTGGIPGSGACMPPGAAMSRCQCQNQYAQPQTFDFGATGAPPWSLQSLFARQQGAQFEGFLQSNPFAKAQLEMMLGGNIVPDGCTDGRITVMPFQDGEMPAGLPMAAAQALGALNQINQAAMALGFMPGMSSGNMNNMFNAMVLGGLSNLMTNGAFSSGGGGGGGGLRALMGGNPFVDWADGAGPRRRGNVFGGGGPQGQGEGFTAGPNHPAQGAFGMGPGGADETAAILNDSSLTVEDKVCLMLMAIMKKMDKEIEKQAQYVNSLQEQQGKKGGGGGGKGGGKGGGGGGEKGGSSPSIDVETMKLKRLIDKRGQMFDMLRQIIDKYNETAKNVIQSMGR